MEFIAVTLVAIGLAMDCFAVSIGIGTTPHTDYLRSKFRLAFHFGFFQTMMTVLGWLAGSTIARLIDQLDHWVALALLVLVGANMIRSGLQVEQGTYAVDPSRGKIMVMLSVATSIDAMAIGLSMAMLQVDVVYPSILIGIVSFTFSLCGLFIGHKLGGLFSKRVEIVGGIILIGIGIRVLVTHLWG